MSSASLIGSVAGNRFFAISGNREKLLKNIIYPIFHLIYSIHQKHPQDYSYKITMKIKYILKEIQYAQIFILKLAQNISVPYCLLKPN